MRLIKLGPPPHVSARGPAYNAPTTARLIAGPNATVSPRRPTVTDMDVNTGARSVLSRSYLASLPERTTREGAALTGGLVYEASEVVLPVAIRRSKLYQAIVGRLLRITVELVGGVRGVYPAQEMPVRELLVRKTAGNVVELSSFLAVGWSPVWLLAGASDVLEGTSGVLADTVDVPPLNMTSVRTSWQELRRQATDLPDAADLERIYAELQLAARQEDRSILEISSMVALGAVRAGVRLGNVHIFDYRGALRTIVEEDLRSFVRRTSTPYLTRAGSHFDPRSSTYSERLLRRWVDQRCERATG